jgi:protease PrsW
MAPVFRAASAPVANPQTLPSYSPKLQARHWVYFWIALLGGSGGMVALTFCTISFHSLEYEWAFVIGGSALAPVLYVFYLDLRSLFVDPRWRTLVATFVLGAILGVPVAFVLESVLPVGAGNLVQSLGIGLIEEGAKLLGLLWLFRKTKRYLSFEMDGIILGAAAGMGFAMLEDIGYGASAFDGGLTSVVFTVWLRILLGPLGHGTWTALVASVIWREKGAGRPRLTLSVLVAYLLAASLHGLWDWEPLPGLWNFLWFALIGAVGLYFLRRRVVEALRQEREYIDTVMVKPDELGDGGRELSTNG